VVLFYGCREVKAVEREPSQIVNMIAVSSARAVQTCAMLGWTGVDDDDSWMSLWIGGRRTVCCGHDLGPYRATKIPVRTMRTSNYKRGPSLHCLSNDILQDPPFWQRISIFYFQLISTQSWSRSASLGVHNRNSPPMRPCRYTAFRLHNRTEIYVNEFLIEDYD